MEPITYTLSHVKSGKLRHHNDDIQCIESHLFTNGSLWTVVIEEGNAMNPDLVEAYRATDEIRHQAVVKACIRANQAVQSRSINVYQIYEALGIEVQEGGIIVE